MKTIITRADDFGSSKAANKAISWAANYGFIKNISIMAVGAYLEEASKLLAHRTDLCFGLHGTLNSEWDKIRWGPVSSKEKVTSLIDNTGYFLQDPAQFTQKPPKVEEILEEYTAQLRRLKSHGFKISYVDSHMFPERFIPGLQVVLSKWIAANGLIDHSFYYNVLPKMDHLSCTPDLFETTLSTLTEGQYFYLAHPAIYSPEITQCGNKEVDGKILAQMRRLDMKFVCSNNTIDLCKRYGFETIRYDEAIPTEKPKDFMLDKLI